MVAAGSQGADIAATVLAALLFTEVAVAAPATLIDDATVAAMPPILKNYATDDKRALAAYLAQLPAPGKAVTPEPPRS